MKFDVLTLFPQLIKPHLVELPFKKAIQNKKLDINVVNLREYAINDYGQVDDKPYGGGVGMIMRIEPIYKALHKIYSQELNQKAKIIVLTPKGNTFTQKNVEPLKKYDRLTFICGRYEGIDARVFEINKLFTKNKIDIELVSIGDYVLSGGEIPTLAIMEAITRTFEGVLQNPQALINESFTKIKIEHPQYTRPEDFMGLKVPEVLLSGNHKLIEEWQKENSTIS